MRAKEEAQQLLVRDSNSVSTHNTALQRQVPGSLSHSLSLTHTLRERGRKRESGREGERERGRERERL